MSNHVRIGVFVPLGAQLLDLATVDVLATMSKEYLSELTSLLPSHVGAGAPSVSISYVSTTEQGRDIPLTAGAVVKATYFYTDAEVAPGKLDVIVVPGPSPTAHFEEGGLRWLKAQFESPGVDVLSVCTGLYICAAAGITDGRKVSGPRGLQGDLEKKHPGIRLVGAKHRWVQDGNLWSSGGVTNGNDLMAAYARASRHWANKPVVEIGLQLTDVGDRGQFYSESNTVFTLGMAWGLLKAWFVGPGKTKVV